MPVKGWTIARIRVTTEVRLREVGANFFGMNRHGIDTIINKVLDQRETRSASLLSIRKILDKEYLDRTLEHRIYRKVMDVIEK